MNNTIVFVNDEMLNSFKFNSIEELANTFKNLNFVLAHDLDTILDYIKKSDAKSFIIHCSFLDSFSSIKNVSNLEFFLYGYSVALGVDIEILKD